MTGSKTSNESMALSFLYSIPSELQLDKGVRMWVLWFTIYPLWKVPACTKEVSDRRQEEKEESWRGAVNSLSLQDGCSLNFCVWLRSIASVSTSNNREYLFAVCWALFSFFMLLARLLWWSHFTKENEAHRNWTTYRGYPSLVLNPDSLVLESSFWATWKGLRRTAMWPNAYGSPLAK